MMNSEIYIKAYKYVDKAKALLEKADREGDYYNKPKYVKKAGKKLWKGIVVALEGKYNLKNGTKKPTFDMYLDKVAAQNKTMSNHLKSGRHHSVLAMGCDGDLLVKTSEITINLVETIINWAVKIKRK